MNWLEYRLSLEKKPSPPMKPAVFFTTPHFDGYPAVLARLELLPVDVLDDLVQRVWREKAPKRVVRGWRP